MTEQGKDYWFPAKTYGWGWGFPRKWQGWLVMLAYIGILILASILNVDGKAMFEFFIALGTATVALVVICYVKGEPPKWRWGDKK